MADYKGTAIVFLRKFIQSYGDACEKEFLSGLSEEDAHIYNTALNVSHIPVETAARLFQSAFAATMQDKPVKEAAAFFGREVAKDNLKGIYKVFLRVMTIPFLLKKSASLWKAYHGAGDASVEDMKEHTANFVVCGYEDFPEIMRDTVTGYIISCVEMCGGKNVKVERADMPPKLMWHIYWE